MKTHLIFTFVVFIGCSNLSFGQSAKKQNEQLRLALNEARENYKTAKLRYNDENLDYAGSLLVPLMDKTQEMIEGLKQNELIKKETFDKNESLKLLQGKITSKAIYSFPKEIPYEDRLKRISDNLSKTFADKSEPVEANDTLKLDVYKLKLENELIQKQIDLFHLAEAEYNKCTRKFDTYRPVIIQATAGIDSIYKEIVNLQTDLQYKLDIVQSELDTLEALYKEKGPKGFPQVYADEFPYAFEKAGEERFAEIKDSGFVDFENDNTPVPDHEETYHIEKEPAIYEVVDESAEFPGGREALNKYLSDHLVLPDAVLTGNVSGKCYVRFVVSEKGQIWQVQIRKGVDGCPECDKEAKRMIEKMPNWIPAKNNGKEVSSWYILPIKFVAP